MNPEKAIEILQKHGVTDDNITWQDYLDAVNLGIEALKRLEYERSLHTYPAYKLLPGETEN